MRRFIRFASIAIVTGFLGAGAAGAETPVLTADCLNDLSLCEQGGSALEPGEVRIRAVSAIGGSGGPLLLTNRDLGLSNEELEAKSAPEEPVEVARLEEPTEEAAPAEEAPAEESAEAAEEEVVPAPVIADSEFTANEDGDAEIDDGMDFSDCMERSIRGGNAFDESQRVCGAVFPE